MAAGGVGRLVAITSSGVRADDPAHPRWYRLLARAAMRDQYADMRLMEEIIRASGVDWIFVRPGRLVSEAPPARVLDGTNPPGGWRVARADVARSVVAVAGGADAVRWSRATPTLAA